jgi:hypothetical protein
VVSDEPSPYGRYSISPLERILNVCVIVGLCVYARYTLRSRQTVELLPSWYRGFLLVGFALLFVSAALQWAFPATVIHHDRIRRVFKLRQRIDWKDVSDFVVQKPLGVKRIYVRLVNGRKYRLDGVPVKALPALREQLGVGGAKTGTWWLVDYSDASSTSSS